jgi:hypothetical protein
MLLPVSSLIFGDDGWGFADSGEAIVQSDVCDPAATAEVSSRACREVKWFAERRIVGGSEIEVARFRFYRRIFGQASSEPKPTVQPAAVLLLPFAPGNLAAIPKKSWESVLQRS